MFNANDQKLHTTWLMLKLTYGIVPIVAGADKFFNFLTPWEKYISPMVLSMLPISATMFMYAVGIIEIIAGLLVLSSFTRLGAYVVALWLTAIAVNLVILGSYDIAIRDVVIAIGAVALAQLTEICSAAHKHV